MFSIQKVDHFPEIARSGRQSEELSQIVEALKGSADRNERFCIAGIEPGNAYNSMQQRIRTQAKKLDLKVIIRYDAVAQNLYFRAFDNLEPDTELEINTSVKASSVKGVKTAKKLSDLPSNN